MPPTCDEYLNTDPQTFWSTYVLPRVIHIEGLASRYNTGSKALAQQMLDSELTAMQFAMCSLRTRRNAFSPVSSLPAEVLVRIFECCAAVQPPVSTDWRPLGWIEVTHVCRLWRDAALQFPGLWNNICFSLGSQWAEMMISRAKAVPLMLCQDVSKASQSSLDLIPKCVPHACELSLVASVSVLKSIISTPLRPSKILRSIELRSSPSLRIFSAANYELPEAMIGCRLPSLRRLALKSFWVPWSAPILCGLTHLEIQLDRLGSRVNESLNFTPEKILSALKNMPDLETLVLQHCLPRGPWRDGGDDILELPRLNVLQLQAKSAACLGITKQLRIPPSCRVRLRCSNTRPTTDVPELTPFLVAHAGAGAGLPPWQTLSLTAALGNHQSLQMWRQCEFVEKTTLLLPDVEADLEISFYDWEPSFGHLRALCQTLPFETITTAHVHTYSNPEVQDWIDILRRCTKVEVASISVDYRTTPSFFTALNMTTDYRPLSELESCQENHRLFLGNLTALTLSDVVFNDTDVPHLQLVRSLTERQRVKPSPKLYLRILDCSIRKEWVEELRNVATVEWNEDEGEWGVDSEEGEEDSEGDPEV